MKLSRSLSSFLGRSAACLLVLNLSAPLGAVATVGKPIAEGLEARADRLKAEAAEKAEREKRRVRSRPLTLKEQKTEQGRTGPNPYLAGQSKWDVLYKGVNLMTGAYTSGGTDLSFDGGYGIPVNVTRSYNSNTVDEGPFGRGWTLSADVRSTAGGMLKSPGSPVRSVPSSFKERPSAETDPNLPMTGQGAQPAEAVVATDASGEEETIQKDADGVLTTPPWDKNVIDSSYETLTDSNGAVYQLLTENVVKTPDGTTYRYIKQGSYVSGTKPWNNPSATAEPANVLKVVEATDRQGNLTTYTYGSAWVTFQKMNGQTQEHPLVKVEMPNGHKIGFTWGDGTAGKPVNRIVDIDDGLASAGEQRHVLYQYDGSGYLTGVTTPGGKKTTYGYSGTYLSSITDPRGYTEGIGYGDVVLAMLPYNSRMAVTAVTGLSHANGTSTAFTYSDWAYSGAGGVQEKAGSVVLSEFFFDLAVSATSNPSVTVTAWVPSAAAVTPGFTGFLNQTAKTYSVFTQDLTNQTDLWSAHSKNLPSESTDARFFADVQFFRTSVDSTYNFQGQPLSQTSTEAGPCATTTALASGVSATVEYAYWGKDKYWQRKMVKDHASRVSFTDYYDASAAAGRKGQTKEVYDAKYSHYTSNGAPVPAGTPSGSTWRYQDAPEFSAFYTSVPVAKFDYDAKGRPIWVDKLRSVTGSGASQVGTYVRTTTTYGADTDGSWGQPSIVVEDAGGIGRTTQTLGYNAQGKATIVKDARGNAFQTHYLPDGEVDWVKQVNPTSLAVIRDVSTYSYGPNPGSGGTAAQWAEYGQLKQVTDGLSGIQQTFEYGTAAGEKGQVVHVSETDLSNSGNWTGYSTPSSDVFYEYWPSGDRATSRVVSNGHTEYWQYADYVAVGEPTGQSRVFRTMRKLTDVGAYTPEEEHFRYDERGRLVAAAFAQTPYRNAQGQVYETNGNSPYYMDALGNGGGGMASARCVAEYVRDAAGRVKELRHWWENRTASSSLPVSVEIAEEAATYAPSGANKGLKTSSTLKIEETDVLGGVLNRSDAYAYDAERGYLTGWTPSDYAAKTWSYDAAGNRGGGTYDALNRQTALGAVSYAVDAAGNRTSKTVGSTTDTFGWDPLNRMESSTGNGYSLGYQYRADGLRAAMLRSTGSGNARVVSWVYDGQMPVEEVQKQGSQVETTRYAIGPRGTERQELTTSSGVDVSYPIYDAHGNQIASVRRDSSNPGGYVPLTSAGVRIYDPWGKILTSVNASARPNQAFCASLGHRKDNETDLVYMRARYYDPSAGRFISEDPAMEGANWFSYCGNDPVNRADSRGRSAEEINEILREAWRLFSNSHWGWGTSNINKSLQELVDRLVASAKVDLLKARAMMVTAAEDEEYAALMGSAGQLQKKIAEIERGLATITLSESVAAKMAIRTIGIMAELLKGQSGIDSWNFWG